MMNKGIKRTRVWRLKLEKFNTKRQLHKREGSKSQGKVIRGWGTLHHSCAAHPAQPGTFQCLTGATATGHPIIQIMKEVTGEGGDAEPRNLRGIAAATSITAPRQGRMWKLLSGQLETLLLKH